MSAAFPSAPLFFKPTAMTAPAARTPPRADSTSRVPPTHARTFVLETMQPPPTLPTRGRDVDGHEIRHGELGEP
jgi:hypothetical protein